MQRRMRQLILILAIVLSGCPCREWPTEQAPTDESVQKCDKNIDKDCPK